MLFLWWVRSAPLIVVEQKKSCRLCHQRIFRLKTTWLLVDGFQQDDYLSNRKRQLLLLLVGIVVAAELLLQMHLTTEQHHILTTRRLPGVATAS
jgi:hypothetical protein